MTLDTPKWTSQGPGVRADAQCSFHMARRTGFREQYYTGTRRYKCVREDCRQYHGETMWGSRPVYHQYLRIGQFVWARVLSRTRYYQSASVDCSGVIQKIHMREIRLIQGLVNIMKCDRFHAQMMLDKAE